VAAQPEPPMVLNGQVYINDVEAEDGTLVEAKIGGAPVANCTTQTAEGKKGYYVLAFWDGGGDEVHLFVGGVEANESPVDYEMGSQDLDLNVTVVVPTVAFSAAAYSVGEGGGSAPITVNLSAASTQTVTVHYATSDGTATAGSDYTAANGTLTFSPGNTSKTFSVSILEDALVEGNETVNLSLTNPSNATLGTPSTAVLTIVDNDAPHISVDPMAKNFGSINVSSSSSPQTFTVRNVGNADLTVGTINITGTNANQFTIQNDNVSNETIIPNGSATLQVVFSPTSTGGKSATLNIPSNDPDEATVLVSLSGSGVAEGPGPGPAEYNLTVDMLGDISKWDISEQGNLLEPLQVSSADNKVIISLDKDASCLDKEDNRLSTITISNQTDCPPVPEDYDIIGTAYEFQPAGAKFAPSLSLTLSYVDNDIPQYVSEEDVYIAYYDTTAENWVPLTSQVDTENNIVTAPVSHFTTFAIMGAAIPPTPANFSVTSLDLSNKQVEPGQEVLVTVNVTNIGGCEGSYALNLTINGAVEQTKTVTLAPLASDTVTFTVTKEEPGSYTISVDGLTKEFSVAALAPSWLSRYWWTILIGLVVVGLLLFFFRWWRQKKAVS